MRLEDRLQEALFAGAEAITESPDLFARLQTSIEEDVVRRRWRRRVAAFSAAMLTIVCAVLTTVITHEEGAFLMQWWILEILTTAILVTIVIVLGPFIKRFGRSYAAEVFRSNPGTGKSFIVLTDFAYYLIFGAYVLFTPVFERPDEWAPMVNAAQLQFELAKVGGILLLMGVLHGANLLMLPIIGRLLTLNRQLDLQMRRIDNSGREE